VRRVRVIVGEHMTAVTNYGTAIVTSVATALAVLLGFIPRLIGALILILIGWIIAGVIYRIVVAILRKLRVNEFAGRHGITAFLERANMRVAAADVIATIAKWYIRLIFLEAAFTALGLPQVVTILNSVLLFLPNLVVALILLFIGIIVARLVRDLVRASAAGLGPNAAKTISSICFFGVLAFFVVAAVGQIGIATAYLSILFSAAVGGLALALALAFGLGGRDAAARAIDSLAESVPPAGAGGPPTMSGTSVGPRPSPLP